MNAASAGFAVRGTGPVAGSSLLLKALDEMGLVVTRRNFPISTLNGNAVAIRLPTIFGYAAHITNNAVTNTAGSVSGIYARPGWCKASTTRPSNRPASTSIGQRLGLTLCSEQPGPARHRGTGAGVVNPLQPTFTELKALDALPESFI